MPQTPRSDFLEILRILCHHGVEFIVVEGVGAVLQGAPLSTFDLDVVHSTQPENITRLLAALEALEARYRFHAERRLKPDLSHLCSVGHQLLMTRFGPLDLLGAIGSSRRYDDLRPHTVELDAGEGVRVRVLDLETLIATKQETAGEKDRAVLPTLRRTLEEKRRR